MPTTQYINYMLQLKKQKNTIKIFKGRNNLPNIYYIPDSLELPILLYYINNIQRIRLIFFWWA